MQDQELLELIRRDSRNFGLLFDAYYPRIKKYILRRVMVYDVAADIASETFIKAYMKIDQFQWKGVPLTAWLYRIATNEINMFFRKQSYSPVVYAEMMDFNKLSSINHSSQEQERDAWQKELKAHDDFIRVQKIISALPEKYQEVLALRYFENKAVKEVADILDKKEGTVKSLLSRGIEMIRDSLGDAT